MPSAKTPKPAKARPMRQPKISFDKAVSVAKTPQKRSANGNILNFFSRIDPDSLFIDDYSSPLKAAARARDGRGEEDLYGLSQDLDRMEAQRRGLTEDGTPSKRCDRGPEEPARDLGATGPAVSVGAAKQMQTRSGAGPRKRLKKVGRNPFLGDSSSDEEELVNVPPRLEVKDDYTAVTKPETKSEPGLSSMAATAGESSSAIPDNEPRKQARCENFEIGDDVEDLFDDDVYEEGDEYREMRFMQEQALLEEDEGGDTIGDGPVDDAAAGDEEMSERCPLCSASLAGITPDEASVHVNACLDGEAAPLPARTRTEATEAEPIAAVASAEVSKRFARAAVARPGQSNPISLATTSTGAKSTSAFSKLMSGHAEEAAWASAAASETASRGKAAYQRTCPFYKIMPGFFICVDAFRYGAVQGCKAYFLSHFHSDHYIGLTASWCHGPIYCSKVTGSLVRNQLRTNARWVVELEFDDKVDVPGTEGVTVTMIPANHCPGSSLFLFEKTMGRSRTQRILHCGDFRACPAHVRHPLLRPDVMDSVSGKAQQIDVCYLDTTYLNPRYSFPPQDDVINTCAEFCRTISADPNAMDDALDALKRDRGSTSVSKFFTKTKDSADGPPAADAQAAIQGKAARPKHRLLVICGTYSIGKERICKAIAQALNTKIFASPAKTKIINQLRDPELSAMLTSDPRAAQVHMQMLMEIRAETLQEYLNPYKPHFTRIVGFRPSGWNFRSPAGSAAKGAGVGGVALAAGLTPSSLPTAQILHGPAWRPRFGPRDLVAQRGSTREAMCFGVPYSEHSSFRELALFVTALRIERVVPTVNVGSEQSRTRMKAWLDRWMADRRRAGIVSPLDGPEPDEADRSRLWDGKDGRGGGAVYYW